MKTRVIVISEINQVRFERAINKIYNEHNIIQTQTHVTPMNDSEDVLFTAILYYEG